MRDNDEEKPEVETFDGITPAERFAEDLTVRFGLPDFSMLPQDRRQAREDEFFAKVADAIATYSPDVLAKAYDHLCDNHPRARGFPDAETCRDACEMARRILLAQKNKTTAKLPPERDVFDPHVMTIADDLLRGHIDLARQAYREGWLLNLWRHLGCYGRPPLSENELGEDEVAKLRTAAAKSRSDLAEFDAHPGGSICESCAKAKRGVFRPLPDEGWWLGKCQFCKEYKDCSAIDGWRWPVVGLAGQYTRASLIKLRRLVGDGEAKQEQRIITLLQMYNRGGQL